MLMVVVFVSFLAINTAGYAFSNEPTGIPYQWKTSHNQMKNIKYHSPESIVDKMRVYPFTYTYNEQVKVGDFSLEGMVLGFVNGSAAVQQELAAASTYVKGQKNVQLFGDELIKLYGAPGGRLVGEKVIAYFWVGEKTIISYTVNVTNFESARIIFYDRKAFEKVQMERTTLTREKVDFFAQYNDMSGAVLKSYLGNVLWLDTDNYNIYYSSI